MYRGPVSTCVVVQFQALEITGILGDAELREGAIIDRDADGNVAGTVREHAIGHMRQFIPPITDDEWEAVGRGFMDWLSSMGITTAQLAAGNEAHLKAATKIEADGDLSVRLAVALNYGYFDSAESLDEEYEFIQRAGAYKTEFVDPGYTKIFIDGVPTAKTGWMVEPYVDSDEDFRGSGYYDADDLNRIYADFTEKGVSVMAHATGSRSVREVLNAIENAQKAFPDSPVRHHLTHNGSVHADDVGRYAELGITADLAPIFPIPPFLAKSAEPMLGKERVDNYTNPRPILDAGGEVAIGSDWSVSPIDPWNRLAFVVSRQDANNLDWGVMQPENAMTVAEAIRAYTWGPAHAINKENETGSIEVGKYADMIVLDRNPFEIDPIEIAGTQVLTTVFAGKEVYEAGDQLSRPGRWSIRAACLAVLGLSGIASAEGIADAPTLPLEVEAPKRLLIDFHHIERNASFTVLAAAYAFNENFLGYFSWDTDDDGVIGGLYINDFANNFNVVGGLVLNDKKAGNHSIMGLTHINYVVGNASIGVGLQLERGLDTKVANTIGKQNTLTYRIIGEYTFPKVTLEVIAEKYDYRKFHLQGVQPHGAGPRYEYGRKVCGDL